MDFDKSDFKKQAPTVSCNACGSEQEKFTLIRQAFQTQQVEFQNPAHGASFNHNHTIRLINANKSEITSFLGKLRKNIFSEVDTISNEINQTKRNWNDKISNFFRQFHRNRGNLSEMNKGILDAFHYVGDESSYNTLLLRPPYNWTDDLERFYRGAGITNVEQRMSQFHEWLKNDGGPNQGRVQQEGWYTKDSEEDKEEKIREWLSWGISGGSFVFDELNRIVDRICGTLKSFEPTKKYAWETNYEKNSPLYVPDTNQLSNQFNDKDVFEGVEYCNHCGAEQSRSLMIETTFKPYSGEENQEFAIHYIGKIQDIHTDVLPQIRTMWKEQLKELNRRIKRVTRRWDAAEERLQKKLEEEEERKRQAEIAKLEKKLNSLKNKDKS